MIFLSPAVLCQGDIFYKQLEESERIRAIFLAETLFGLLNPDGQGELQSFVPSIQDLRTEVWGLDQHKGWPPP